MKIKLIQTQRVLAPTQISLASYAVNPYRGCAFACLYCYSRENKNFSSALGVKINAAAVLEKELRFRVPQRVLLGSTTECFQPIERKYRLTEKILKILNARNIPYTILTKSQLISGYLPLISQNKENKIYFTLNCASDKTARALEPNSPLVAERLKTIKAIVDHKINLRIHIGPFIPYLSDLEEILSILPPGIKEIGIELYHHKMGNFAEIQKTLASSRLKEVYESEGNYLRFANSLEAKIKQISHPAEFFLTIPDFNKYYNSNIAYEK